jgi:hypothetical protein
LLELSRTPCGTRRCSEDDLSVVRRVIELLEAGLDLVGIIGLEQSALKVDAPADLGIIAQDREMV